MVVTGKNHVISFGSATRTIRIPYTREWGDLYLEVGLVEKDADVVANDDRHLTLLTASATN
jgi:hypothetical protein